MTDEAGQGDSPTGAPDAGQLQKQLEDLRSQLSEANQTIERYRGTQSSNDRALADLRTRNTDLQSKLETSTQSLSQLQADLKSAAEARDTLSQRVEELSPFQQQAQTAQLNAEKMALAAVKAGQTPAISILVKSGALPQADSLEDFEAKLDEISESLSAAVGDAARSSMQGARPGNVRKVEQTPDSLEDEALRLMSEGNLEEGIKLHTEALKLRAQSKA